MTTLYEPEVDRLGYLRAQIADLQEQAKEIEDELKAQAPCEFEGNTFRAVVSVSTRSTVAWKKVAEYLEPSRQLLAAHTTTAEVSRLTVSARKKVAA